MLEQVTLAKFVSVNKETEISTIINNVIMRQQKNLMESMKN